MTIYGTDKNFFINGDRAEYTGHSEALYGETCYEGKLLEGHKKGETVWTYRKPGQIVANLEK